MASIVTHAALPLIVGRWLGVPRRALIGGAVIACLPDLDVLAPVFDVPLAHRGLTHSIAWGLAVGVATAWLLCRGSPQWRRCLWFLVASALSHPLFDAMTTGDVGVALLDPFSDARVLLPWRPVPVNPVGANEAFGSVGLIVFLNELLWLWAPLLIIAALVLRAEARRLAVAAVIVWAAVAWSVRRKMPELFAVPMPRLLAYAPDLALVPIDQIPGGHLVIGFDELRQRGLFEVVQRPAVVPWSGEFFPAWFGGESGRWRDSHLRLIGRTLFGTEPGGPIGQLSPIEKYDVAVGDSSFTASRASLAHTHNARPMPRFWYGLCNGVAAASIREPEPFRVVTVVSPSGVAVPFHPNDVKALLAFSHYWTDGATLVGEQEEFVDIDSGKRSSMNPATLVLTLLNRVGLAKQSLLIDVYPTPQTQFYAVGSALVHVAREPYLRTSEPFWPAFDVSIAKLVDVEITVELSSTTLPSRVADVLDSSHADGSWYQLVGFRPVVKRWSATLVLDARSQIIGGRWTGENPNGPDSAVFVEGGPLLVDGGVLDINNSVRWDIVEAIAHASVDHGAAAPRVDLSDGGLVSAP